MSYQIIPLVKAVKAGLADFESRGVVWVHGTHKQGLRYLNLGGKTILIARSETAAAGDFAAFSTGQAEGTYAALLNKEATATARSVHVQFTPATGITVSAFCTAMDDATPAWSFKHYLATADGPQNGPQFELYFEDPVSDAWLEITVVPLQNTSVGDAWLTETITKTDTCGYGGNTPNGGSVFEWGPLTSLTLLEAAIDTVWANQEQGTSVAAYLLKRVRIELWEAAPTRTAYIDTIVIAATAYAVEPGLAGIQLGPNLPIVTLSFMVERDPIFGRTETLAPVLGAKQSLIVGPLLPELFNDSDGYVRFKPNVSGDDKYYSAIQVG